tara:strand:+ start:153 stop:389 length:237 start_codon:yes stop_codon:yes gene_type:complete
MTKIKKGGETSQHHSKSFEEICRFFNDAISEEDLDKWGEVKFEVRRAKEEDIAPLPGVMEVEMRYGNNIMRTRIKRAT